MDNSVRISGKPVVGILGVGKIGMSVARRLLADGYPVIGLSLDPLDELVRLGGRTATTGEAVGRECDIVIEVLGSEPAFDSVVFGENGLVKSARPGTTMVTLSSYPLAFKEAQTPRLAAHGLRQIDAAVSGSPTKVDAGEAIIFAAGDAALLEAAGAVLASISPQWVNVGAFGHATKLKFVNNTLSFVHNLAAAEALALGVRLGLDGKDMVKWLGQGTGGSAALSFRGPKMAERRYPVTGDLGGAMLVVHSILDAAASVNAEMPLMSRSAELYQRAIDQGLADEDVAQLFELLIAGDAPAGSAAVTTT